MSIALTRTVRGLLILTLLTPLVISPGAFAHFGVSKAVYARVLIEIMFVAWVFLAVKYPEFRPPRSKVLLALFLYVLASLLAGLWGVNPTHSFWSSYDRMTGVVDLVHWLLFALVLVSVLRLPKSWTALFNWQLGVTLALSAIALTQAYGYSFIPSVLSKCRVDATLGNPSFLAPILVVSILIAAGLLLQSILETTGRRGKVGPVLSADEGMGVVVPSSILPLGQREEDSSENVLCNQRTPARVVGWRTFWLTVIAAGLYVLILTGTRGALIGLVAGVSIMPLAMLIWGNRQSVKAATLLAAGILATVGILFAVDHIVGLSTTSCADQTASNRLTNLASTGTGDASLATRLAAIEAGFQGFLERPVFGWGPENFSYAFDRYVDAWVFRHGSFVQDKAHNQVIEELTTKGLVGTVAFMFMWLSLAWAVVRRRRSAGEDALAYAVLGGLVAYFVQNLFLFDTPSTLLVWLIMVGWVARREHEDSANGLDREKNGWLGSGGIVLAHIQRIVQSTLSLPGGRVVGATALVALLGVSLYSLNLQPYLAARTFGQASQPGLPISDRLALAEESFETFPAMANQPRRLMMLQFVRLWDVLNDEDQRQVREFFGKQASTALTSDPRSAPMLITVILFIQSTAQNPEMLASLSPMLKQLQTVAPHRAETHQLLANQALKEGRYAEALSIAREYQSAAPGTDWFFAGIERAAQAGLGQGRD